MTMLRYALTYGMLAGFVIVATALAAVMTMGQNHVLGSVYLGYLVMVLALTLIFVGVKRYRDVDHGGVIRFVPALKMGLAIALAAAAVYIIVWEVYLASTGYRFMDDYLAHLASQGRAEGKPPAEIARELAGMEWMRAGYANPLIRVPLTFVEIFPVGLVIALISAALLRNPKLLPAKRQSR
jgi:hypothetical protein